MIPHATRVVIGTQRPCFLFDGEAIYYVDPEFLSHLEVLMRRLGTERTMGADEMRDWMNYLHSQLSRSDVYKVEPR